MGLEFFGKKIIERTLSQNKSGGRAGDITKINNSEKGQSLLYNANFSTLKIQHNFEINF